MLFNVCRLDIEAFSKGMRAWIVLGLVTFLAAAPGLIFLPVLDRDEARYAQATTQMLETDDYVQIKFQNQARNKKPIGTYWLQASATALLSNEQNRAIWTYRLPSLIAGVLATLGVFACGQILLSRRDAFVGALLFGSTILLTTEAHIAKTDSLLLLSIILMMIGLAKIYTSTEPNPKWSLLFWLSLGIGILIKGPVAPMIGGLTFLFLFAVHRAQHSGLRTLINAKHIVLMLVLVLPWFIAIQIATSGGFLTDALGKELNDKIGGASEGHGGPPGYHLAFLTTHFFPATLLVIPGVILAVHQLWNHIFRRSSGLQASWHLFLFAWLVPSWIVFEMLPTKLSHYTLPLYPALALIVGASAVNLIGRREMSVTKYVGAFFFVLGGFLLLTVSSPWVADALKQSSASEFQSISAASVLETWQMSSRGAFVFWGVSLVTLLTTLWFFIRRKSGLTLGSAVLGSVFLGIHIRADFLPNQTWLDPTGRALEAIAFVQNCQDRNSERGADKTTSIVRSFGYAEPSLVFRTQTGTLLPPNSQNGWVEGLYRGDVSVFNLEEPGAREIQAALKDLSARSGLKLIQSPTFPALNYTEGDPVNFKAVSIAANICDAQ